MLSEVSFSLCLLRSRLDHLPCCPTKAYSIELTSVQITTCNSFLNNAQEKKVAQDVKTLKEEAGKSTPWSDFHTSPYLWLCIYSFNLNLFYKFSIGKHCFSLSCSLLLFELVLYVIHLLEDVSLFWAKCGGGIHHIMPKEILCITSIFSTTDPNKTPCNSLY